MDRKLRFGIITPQYASWQQMIERWRHVEALGFDSVWVADHFVWYPDPTVPFFEAWTLLAGLATHTSRIRIGTLVTAIPFRNPAILARQALTVDHLSNGRLELGLGTGIPGEADPSYAMTGIEAWPPAERVARFREVIEIVDQLLRLETSSYQGRYYQLKDTMMRPRPVQQPRPPLTVAAHGPAMLKLAARHADTWSTVIRRDLTPDAMLELIRRRIALLEDYCAEIGRDPSTLRRSLLTLQVTQAMYASVNAFEDLAGRYVDAGINEIILGYPDQDERLPVLERIATEVIPRLRGD